MKIRLASLILLALTSVFLVGACSQPLNCYLNGSQNRLKILFIGNSYTYVNDLPGTFSKLACSGGQYVTTSMQAEGGWTLTDHAASQKTLDAIASQKWDIVVLQEQSEVPAIAAYRAAKMYPAVRLLAGKIRDAGAQPMLFLTWAHRDGSTVAGTNNFNDMQSHLYEGIMGIANELELPVAPVGFAWLRGRIRPTPLDLWQEDGSHPNESGTYLAACVFYAAIFAQSPAGLTYRGSLSPDLALDLQNLAADTVINELDRWKIRQIKP